MKMLNKKSLLGFCALGLLLLSCENTDNTNKKTVTSSTSSTDGTTSTSVQTGLTTSSTTLSSSYMSFVKSNELQNLNTVLGLSSLSAVKSNDNLKYSLDYSFDGLKSKYSVSNESFTSTYGTYRLLSKNEIKDFKANNNNLPPSLFVLIKDSTETRADLGADGWVIYLPKDFINKNKLTSVADKINDDNILSYVNALSSSTTDNAKVLKTVIKKDASLQNINVNEITTNKVTVVNYSLILEDTIAKTNTNLVEVTHTLGTETINSEKIKNLEEKIVIGDYSLIKNTGIYLGTTVNSDEDAGGEDDQDKEKFDPTAQKTANKYSVTFKNKDQILFSTDVTYLVTYNKDTLKSSETRTTIIGNYKLKGEQTASFIKSSHVKTAISNFNLYEITSSGDVLVGKLNFNKISDLNGLESATITTTDNQTKTLGELVSFSSISQVMTAYYLLSGTLRNVNSLYVKLIKTSIHKDQVYKKENKGKVKGRKN